MLSGMRHVTHRRSLAPLGMTVGTGALLRLLRVSG